jgi:hypothetical protein
MAGPNCGTYKADVVSIHGNSLVVQISGTGNAIASPLDSVGNQQNLCELIVDAWGS